MIDPIFGITWQSSSLLVVFIPLLAIVIFMLVRVYRRSRGVISALAHERHRDRLFQGFSLFRFKLRLVLFGCAMLCCMLALLRPQWDRHDSTALQEGRDLIVALDISRSMLAQDYEPNRLECAKRKIKTLLKKLDSERVGLLIFSGAALMQCPLTTDFDAFTMFLDELSVESISSGTTSLASALQKACEAFSSFDAGRTKLVALFTDGEDFSSDFAGVKQKIADAGIHVFAFGIGTEEGSPIPAGTQLQDFQKDSQGHVVISRLNSTLISDLAHETGGKYIQVTNDDRDIDALKQWVEFFEKTAFDKRNVQELHDKFYWYAALAFALMVIQWIL